MYVTRPLNFHQNYKIFLLNASYSPLLVKRSECWDRELVCAEEEDVQTVAAAQAGGAGQASVDVTQPCPPPSKGSHDKESHGQTGNMTVAGKAMLLLVDADASDFSSICAIHVTCNNGHNYSHGQQCLVDN